MRRRLGVVVVLAAALAALAWGSVAAAQGRLPKLPAGYTLAQTGDSPGKVTFNHESHVDADRPSCTSCHPKVFSILKAGAAADGKPLTHDNMNKGAACGTCHGKTAFGFDDCTMCHHSE
jgi:c(7)-type cytochrome triheme protein